jgi:hypothetical protein
MIKRLTWFVGGAVAGAAGVGVAKRKIKAKAAELAPARVARSAADRVRDAVGEGRSAMRTKEAELRARLDGRLTPLAAEVDGVDAVLVDGQPIDPSNVVLLRQRRATTAVSGDARRTAPTSRRRRA